MLVIAVGIALAAYYFVVRLPTPEFSEPGFPLRELVDQDSPIRLVKSWDESVIMVNPMTKQYEELMDLFTRRFGTYSEPREVRRKLRHSGDRSISVLQGERLKFRLYPMSLVDVPRKDGRLELCGVEDYLYTHLKNWLSRQPRSD
jgi:hypothetical protein